MAIETNRRITGYHFLFAPDQLLVVAQANAAPRVPLEDDGFVPLHIIHRGGFPLVTPSITPRERGIRFGLGAPFGIRQENSNTGEVTLLTPQTEDIVLERDPDQRECWIATYTTDVPLSPADERAFANTIDFYAHVAGRRIGNLGLLGASIPLGPPTPQP